jgi:hypothetical protein
VYEQEIIPSLSGFSDAVFSFSSLSASSDRRCLLHGQSQCTRSPGNIEHDLQQNSRTPITEESEYRSFSDLNVPEVL